MKSGLVIFTIFFTTTVFSQGLPRHSGDVTTLIKDAGRFENSLDEKLALDKYKEAFKLQPSNVLALNKCSELCSRIGTRETDDKTRAVYYQNAKNYAAAALQIKPENAEANCVMAIALGCIALNGSSREKVDAARDIKKYLDKAIIQDPMNFKAWHVLGRWNYEMSGLNIFQRAAVKIIFGGLPPSSLQQSITAFEKANRIKTFAANNFEMARAYKRNGETDKAIAVINSLLQLPNQTEDDEDYKNEGRKLLKQWQ